MGPEPIELVTSDERSPATAHAAMLEALVAGEGLARVAEIAAEHVGAPVGIYVPRPGSDGSDGTAAERYVAALVAGGDWERPEEVAAVVPISSHGALQGAVVMLAAGEQNGEEYLNVAALAALTGVAMLNARETAGEDADGGLIAALLAGRELGAGELVRRARRHGCDLADGLAALCVNPGEASAGNLVATIAAELPGVLVEICEERVYALVPGPLEPAEELSARLGERATAALSSRYRRPTDAHDALDEAELLLTLTEAGGRSSTERQTWDSIRILYRTYIGDPLELAEFSERTVGALVRHDEEQGSELQVTFWAYQEGNCNMNVTAKSTFTHRHTVANRLARIEELTGLDPVRSYDRELLSLALKSHYVISLSRPR